MNPESRDAKLLSLLLAAYPDRVTVRREGDLSRGVMVGGRGVVLEPSSSVRKAPLFLSIDPRDVPGGSESRVSIASAIEEDWLEEVHPHLFERRTVHRFDEQREKVLAIREVVFAGLIIRQDIAGGAVDKEAASRAVHEFLARDAAGFLGADEGAMSWLSRLRCLRLAMPDCGLPVDDHPFLEEVLRRLCDGCSSVAEVRRRSAVAALNESLDWRTRQSLDDHAPETILVPSGSRIRLQYTSDGSAPILAVRLQEVFGLAQTPRIAAGRVAVVMHLLAPNHRPVQVTRDLASFWNSTYQEVRKELRARYPKHPWPEDPWNAPAVSVGRRRPPPN